MGTAKKLAWVLFEFVLAAIFLAKLAIDSTGEIAVFQDAKGIDGVWREGAHWLFSTPYWVPSVLLLAVPIIAYRQDISRFLSSSAVDGGDRLRAAPPPQSLSVEPTRVAHTDAPAVPDMTIRELFNFISPEQLDNPHRATWAKVGRNVMDKLSTGQISSWGRALDSRGAARPLTRISADFWDFAEWTYDFFADGMENRVHARDRRQGHDLAYLDIRFNRAEAEPHWRQSERFISLYEAALRLIDAKFPWYDDASRGLVTDPEIYWAYWIWKKTQIYGKHLPARVLHPLPSSPPPNFRLEGQSIVSGKQAPIDRWEDLSILSSSFPLLLEQARIAAGIYGEGRKIE